MKKTSILCAVLVGTFGFGTIASAQDWRNERRGGDQRWEQRQQPQHQQRGDGRNAQYQERRDDRNWNNNRGYQQRGYVYNQPAYGYNQPQYVYNQAPRYYRGGYLPRQYLSNSYYVNNWQAYPGLYAPPYGYQWIDTGGDFVLAALATGLIANLLVH